eukprot:NODE_1153_length_1994_cov_0.799472.p1 type:complete len:542 gc:universal NODE_1153_length_1994_cov_0.799472:1955-330(-)
MFELRISEILMQEYILQLIELDFEGVFICIVETGGDGNDLYPIFDMLLAPFKEDIAKLVEIVNNIKVTFPSAFASTLCKFVVYTLPNYYLHLTNEEFLSLILENYPTVDRTYSKLILDGIKLSRNVKQYKKYIKNNELKVLYMIFHENVLEIEDYFQLFPNAHVYLIPLYLQEFLLTNNPRVFENLPLIFENVRSDIDIDFLDFVTQILQCLVDLTAIQDINDICKDLLQFCIDLIHDLELNVTENIQNNLQFLCQELHVPLNIDPVQSKVTVRNEEDIKMYLQDTEPSIVGFGLHLISNFDSNLVPLIFNCLEHEDPFVVMNAIFCLVRCSNGHLPELVEYILVDLHKSISYLLNISELCNKLVLHHRETIFNSQILEIPLRILSNTQKHKTKINSIGLTPSELKSIKLEIEREEEMKLAENALRGSCLSVIQYAMKYSILSVLPYIRQLSIEFCNLLQESNTFEARAISMIFGEILMNESVRDKALLDIFDDDLKCRIVEAFESCNLDDSIFMKNREIVYDGFKRLPIEKKFESILKFV